MKPRPHAMTPRKAFTLVEMLVVMSIIFILVGLLLVGISAATTKAYEARIRSDITNLDNAIGQFRSDYGNLTPPTNLVIAANYQAAIGSTNNANLQQIITDSQSFLKKMFPRWNPSPYNGNNPLSNGLPTQTGINFQVISGSQVLVFLLGGYAQHGGGVYAASASGLGFSDDPVNPFGNPYPVNATPAITFKKPYFDFPAGKLSNRTSGGSPQPMVISNQFDPNFSKQSVFPGFLDAYDVPYAYLGSRNGNDYADLSSTYSSKFGYLPLATNSLGGSLRVICATPTGNNFDNLIDPYVDSTGKFVKPNGFQIISAGTDGQYRIKDPANGKGGFGPGGKLWQPSNNPYYQQQSTGYGYDDVSNFSSKLLGIP